MWLVTGWLLGVIVTRLPFQLPTWVSDAILFGFRVRGHRVLDNPEDVDTIALLMIIIACFIAAASVLWGSRLPFDATVHGNNGRPHHKRMMTPHTR
jgi:hypothetical protein